MWCRSWYQRDATSCATHHAWNFILFRCLLFGFWIRHTWFGLLGPGWFCQITSPEQLGGCGTRVSSSDFCFWWSSLSQLRCFRKCTTVIPSQRDVRSKELDLMFDGSTFWSNTCLILGEIWVLTQVSRVHAWVGFGILWVVPSTSMTKSHKSSAGKTSIRKPASNDMISDSVELWDTDVCFLHIQLIVTNMWLPKMHRIPPDVDFQSSRSPVKSGSWNNPNRQCWAALPTWKKLAVITREMMEINRASRLSHACVHFVTDRASLLTDHRMSGRPIRARYKPYNTIWE